MFSIFSCTCQPSVSLLCQNIFLGLLPSFCLSCSFLILSYMNCLYTGDIKPLLVLIFSPFHRLSFPFVYAFFCCAKALSLIRSHCLFLLFSYFCLGTLTLRNDTGMIYVRKCFAYVLFKEFHSVTSFKSLSHLFFFNNGFYFFHYS